MATRPVTYLISDSEFTTRELTCGGYVAAALWALSFVLLASLAAWTTGPNWAAT